MVVLSSARNFGKGGRAHHVTFRYGHGITTEYNSLDGPGISNSERARILQFDLHAERLQAPGKIGLLASHVRFGKGHAEARFRDSLHRSSRSVCTTTRTALEEEDEAISSTCPGRGIRAWAISSTLDKPGGFAAAINETGGQLSGTIELRGILVFLEQEIDSVGHIGKQRKDRRWA